ncbi:MAG: pyridoxamine 5'-phosphate oxidase [Bacteroidota bacterium]|nr:pyridoxamine 5'-phosphate oxidase [Ignavibacteria bacterium]MCU7498466.1 pyridoxamine 5'-phosphate oxidase [Ignavibacteria bacterium]MCU7512636.1 pyridoxamine 5'-phosphate oxidase [Ignavibacteria bacterium]MCU7521244.1 pyridoxamine 5'-phosphate oxidase [Ignavibacteria bacterium]MCU7525032.1 pyridoxamine 5'-phosphate oxidase [Ignavibacteria bacterium]
MTKDLASIRRDYILKKLSETDIDPDPVSQFKRWLNEAIEACVNEPTAMALATSTKDGHPSVRIVLLKKVAAEGFVFFTNYNSHKGRQILENPHAALAFYWSELERQVRVEGRVAKLSEKDSDEYFYSRPLGSRIGAWASPQSEVIPSRAFLDEMVLKYQKQFQSGTIERPSNWGGFCLEPRVIEFWQGRESRLHDRIQFTKEDSKWKIDRLAP